MAAEWLLQLGSLRCALGTGPDAQTPLLLPAPFFGFLLSRAI